MATKDEILNRYIDGPKKFEDILSKRRPLDSRGNGSLETEEGLLDQLDKSTNKAYVPLFYFTPRIQTDFDIEYERAMKKKPWNSTFVVAKELFYFK